jgi:glyoxylate reductase
LSQAESSTPRVFVTRSLAGLGEPDLLEPLRAVAQVEVFGGTSGPSREELQAAIRGAEGLLCLLTDQVDERLIEASPQLRVISSMSVGVDHIDVAAAGLRQIPVGHTPGVLAETTADLAFALMLAAARRIPEADRMVREGRWTAERRWAPDMLLGVDVHGAVLGVIGLGAIGQAVARRAAGFGMKVLGFTRSARTVDGVESVSLSSLLERSDFVSVHVALAPETQGLLGAEAIAAMKPGAVLVNSARGGIVDELALANALSDGRLAAAALDVFDDEPLAATSPLLGAPNLVLAPHIGSASVATRRRMAALAVDNLIAGLRGRPMPHAVPPREG